MDKPDRTLPRRVRRRMANRNEIIISKYTNPAKGFLDFCRQKLTAPPIQIAPGAIETENTIDFQAP